MTEAENEVTSLTLSGDFSIAGVSDQLSSLLRQLARMAAAAPDRFDAALPCNIDLGEVRALDCCGCQLLAAFFRHLRQGAAGRLSLHFRQEHRQMIHLLGFDSEIFAEEHS